MRSRKPRGLAGRGAPAPSRMRCRAGNLAALTRCRPQRPRRATARSLPPGMVRARGRRSVSGGVSRSRHRIDPPAWPDPLTRARPAPHGRIGARVAVVRLPMAPDAGAGPRPHRDDGRAARAAGPGDDTGRGPWRPPGAPFPFGACRRPERPASGHQAEGRTVGPRHAAAGAREDALRATGRGARAAAGQDGAAGDRCRRPGPALPPQGTGCAGRQCQGGRRAMITPAGRWGFPHSSPRSPCRSGSASVSGSPCRQRP